MSYYQFNRKEVLQKAKQNYSKEKDVKYFIKKTEVIKEKSKNRYKNLPEKEKGKIKKYQKE